MYGMALTMAAKIQAVGTPGEVWIGERLHGHLHVNNRDPIRFGPGMPAFRPKPSGILRKLTARPGRLFWRIACK
jgi:hypothetical protein